MSFNPSASSLERVLECAASHVLPAADRINEALDLAERLLRAAVPKAKAIEDSFRKEKNSP